MFNETPAPACPFSETPDKPPVEPPTVPLIPII